MQLFIKILLANRVGACADGNELFLYVQQSDADIIKSLQFWYVDTKEFYNNILIDWDIFHTFAAKFTKTRNKELNQDCKYEYW